MTVNAQRAMKLGTGNSDSVGAPTHGVEQAQRKQAKERSAAPNGLAILAVEPRRVSPGVTRGRIPLLPACAAVALAAPTHDLAVAPEAVAMSEDAAPDHWFSGYAAREVT
jgi:hypothetical protein